MTHDVSAGAAQADAALLLVDGSPGGFEAGFESAPAPGSAPGRGGQTREHAQLARSLGVEQLAVVVSKLDTCGYSQARGLLQLPPAAVGLHSTMHSSCLKTSSHSCQHRHASVNANQMQLQHTSAVYRDTGPACCTGRWRLMQQGISSNLVGLSGCRSGSSR